MNEHQTKLAKAITEALSSHTNIADLAERTAIDATDLEAIGNAERLPSANELRRLLSGAGIAVATFFRSLPPWAEREVRHLLQHGTLPAAPKAAVQPQPEGPDQRSHGRQHLRAVGDRAPSNGSEGKVGGGVPVSIGVIRAQLGPWFELSATGNGAGRDSDKSDGANGETGEGEIIFRWSDPQVQLDVCVFTTISNQTKQPHPIGADALRVVVYDARSRRKIEPWSCRIYRVKDWPTRLRRLAGEAILRATYRPRCKKCPDSPELRIVGNAGAQFWGCPNYSDKQCRYTRWLGPQPGFVPLDQPEDGAVIGEHERPRPGKTDNRSRAVPVHRQHRSRAALAS